ncbi:MAG: Ig-like domain-containing protein [Anaerolineales bacterium]|nr:Ig-like domain-containing protein [Anaerolineales bacterium]
MIRRRKRLPSVVSLLFGAAILAVLGLIFSPKITTATPLKASLRVPARAPVSLTFNQPMDAVSVESRFFLDPWTEGSFSWEGQSMTFQPSEPWPAGTDVTVTLKAGARSLSFLPLLRSYTFQFTVGSPRIAYLWPDGAPADIYARTLESAETTRLTTSSSGVLDFSISPGKSYLIYTAMREDGGSDLVLYDLSTGWEDILYSCEGPVLCSRPVLSPDSNTLAFERDLRSLVQQDDLQSSREVRIMSLESEEAVQVGPLQHERSNPTWSITGELAYFDHTLQAVAVVDPYLDQGTSPLWLIPATVDANLEWLPDGSGLLFPQVQFEEGRYELVGVNRIPVFHSHIMYYDLGSDVVIDLSGDRDGLVEDSLPVYDPSSRWIGFTRRYLEPERWTLGRQVWVMAADASEKTLLVNEPDYNHASLVWSPDSSRLVYTRFNQSEISEQIEIWMVNLDTGETEQLVVGGYTPQWIP